MRKITILLMLALAAASVFASAQTAPADLLNKARTLSTLHQDSSPSYHLKASFHTFDEKGAPNGDGTVEEWYQHGGSWRRTVTLNGKTDITLVREHEKPMYKTDDDFEPTFLEERMVKALFEPVDLDEKGPSPNLTKQEIKAGSSQLTCVMISLPLPDAKDSKPAPPDKAYCVDSDPGMVRMVQAHDGFVMTWNNIAKIATIYFPRDIKLQELGILRATLHVDELEASPTSLTNSFGAIPDSVPERMAVVNASETPKGQKLSGRNPDYPSIVRARHVKGTVTLRVRIARDGHIRDLELVSTPDVALVQPTIEAVRDWKYRPYQVEGKPVEAEALISVSFF